MVGPGPRTQHDYHHDTKVKPEAATAVIELLLMGGKTPEACRAVNKRQDNKLKNCCISSVIYVNHIPGFFPSAGSSDILLGTDTSCVVPTGTTVKSF